jgi:hypothetical protein
MPEPNPFPWAARVVVAAALAVWLAAAVWLLVAFIGAEPTHVESPFRSLGMLLLPAVLFAVVALVLVVLPRRSNGAWMVVLVFALFGLPWWLLLRRSVYHAAPWVGAPLVTAAVWMTLGLMLGLIALSITAARTMPAPSERRLTPDEAGALARVETPALAERRFAGKNVPGP